MSFIKTQTEVIKKNDPAFRKPIEILLYPSFYAILGHKMSHFLYKKKWYFTANFVSKIFRFLTGIEICAGACIKDSLFIDHGMGVVIGETCKINDNVVIYQGCTLGGTGKDKGDRHPKIGNNVVIGANSVILGNIKICDNSKIGAGTVVLHDIPANSVIVGEKGKIIKTN